MQGERISWIDVARGIGIILVIYGHGLSGESYRHLIYSFHLPLFFFLSGVLFHHRNYQHFLLFIGKSIKSIIYPYILFALISFLLIFLNSSSPHFSLPGFLKQLWGIIYGNSQNLSFNVALWFLPCLFVTKVSFAVLTKYIARNRYIACVLVLFSVVGYALSIFVPTLRLPFGAESAVTAIVFFGAGFLWNKRAQHINYLVQKYALPLCVLFFLICFFIATLSYNLSGHQIDLRLNRLDNYFLFYGASISGIIGSIALSKLLHHVQFLAVIGRNSLILFIWHLVVFSYLARILRIFLTPETLESMRNSFIAPTYTVLSILIILFFSFLVKKLQRILFSSKDAALASQSQNTN